MPSFLNLILSSSKMIAWFYGGNPTMIFEITPKVGNNNVIIIEMNSEVRTNFYYEGIKSVVKRNQI